MLQKFSEKQKKLIKKNYKKTSLCLTFISFPIFHFNFLYPVARFTLSLYFLLSLLYTYISNNNKKISIDCRLNLCCCCCWCGLCFFSSLSLFKLIQPAFVLFSCKFLFRMFFFLWSEISSRFFFVYQNKIKIERSKTSRILYIFFIIRYTNY